MKKIKIILVSVAVATGIGGAFATPRCQACTFYDQYRYNNGSYEPAGVFGVTYICTSAADVCTYYRPYPSSPFLPCKSGGYYLIQ